MGVGEGGVAAIVVVRQVTSRDRYPWVDLMHCDWGRGQLAANIVLRETASNWVSLVPVKLSGARFRWPWTLRHDIGMAGIVGSDAMFISQLIDGYQTILGEGRF